MAVLSFVVVPRNAPFLGAATSSFVSRLPQTRQASSSEAHVIKDSRLGSLRRGTGGRSSYNGVTATVFGSSGFLGRYICNRLGKTGTQMVLPYRGDHYEMLRLKVSGDLGQVLFQPYDLRDEKSLYQAMKYSNVVINLIGRDWETMNFTFDEVHAKGAQKIARIAKECGVEKLVHFSALNAQEHPEGLVLPGGSKFLASKWKGEQLVREEFPDAVIIRPSDIYGQEDRFLRYYAAVWRRQMRALPLWHKGEKTIKQPVFVSDVAAGVMQVLKDPESQGKTYQFVGPKRYLLSELVDYFYRVMRKDKEWGYFRYDLRYDPLFKLRVTLTEKFSPSFPINTLVWDKVEREHVTDEVFADLPTLEDLNVSLTTIEERVPWELKPYRALNYYDAELNEFEKPAPPNVVPGLGATGPVS